MADYPIDASNAAEPQNTRKVAFSAEEIRALKTKLNGPNLTISGVFSASSLALGLTVPAVKLHVKSSIEFARFETTAARGTGQLFQSWYDPTGRKGYFGFGSNVNDILSLVNELGTGIQIRDGVSGNTLTISGNQLLLPADATTSSGAVRKGQLDAAITALAPVNISARPIFQATKPGIIQPIIPAFAGVNGSSGSWTVSQTGSGFDGSTGIFTAPLAGWYDFACFVGISKTNNTDTTYVRIYGISASVGQIALDETVAQNSANSGAGASSGPVYLPIGTQVRVEVASNVGVGSQNVTDVRFSGRFIQP